MTKADIINSISERTGLPKKDISTTVEAFMAEIRVCMAEQKESVFLRGFGTFTIKHRAKKTARNISKNTTLVISLYLLLLFLYFKGAYRRSLETSLVHSFHFFLCPSELTCSYDDSCAVSSCACE